LVALRKLSAPQLSAVPLYVIGKVTTIIF